MASDGYVHRLNDVEYDARSERLLGSVLHMPAGTGAFSARGGRRVHGAGLSVSVGGGPEQVTVTPGAGVVSPGSGSTGPYGFEIPTTINITLPARPGTGLSRIDLVVAQIFDADESAGPGKEVKVVHVPGTPSGSPAAPSQPALSLLLATLTVPSAGTISVTQSTARTVAAGGVLPVATTAERDALTAYQGLVVHNQQVGGLQVHDGSAWRSVAPAQRQIEVGTGIVSCPNANTTYNAGVTFDTPFPSGVVPRVALANTTSAPQARMPSIGNITNTGFTLYGQSTVASQSVSVNYIAVAP